jgi:hypothetical protein
MNAQLQFIFERCEVSERFPLGVKTTYRAYASDSVVELWNKDSIPWSGGLAPADIVGLVPVRVLVKPFPAEGMCILRKLPVGGPKVASFSDNHMNNIDIVLKFVARNFTHPKTVGFVTEWNHWAESRYPVKMNAEEYVKIHPMHIPFNSFIFNRTNKTGALEYSSTKPLPGMFDLNTLLCAESQPSVHHQNQTNTRVPSRVLIADDRLESCTVIVPPPKKRPRKVKDIEGRLGSSTDIVPASLGPRKKARRMNYRLGQRVDFKFKKCSTWIAGKIIKVDEDNNCYSVVDGEEVITDSLMEHRLREAELYQVNAAVYAKYKNSTNLFPGRISSVNENFTYNVAFDDEDFESNVTIDCLEPRETEML